MTEDIESIVKRLVVSHKRDGRSIYDSQARNELLRTSSRPGRHRPAHRGPGESAAFRLDEALKVYPHRDPIDFRLKINGLALLVQKSLDLDPFASSVYVFSNGRRNRVKILGWARTGFRLLLRHREHDRFIRTTAGAVPGPTIEQRHWPLEGVDIAVAQRHPRQRCERVA